MKKILISLAGLLMAGQVVAGESAPVSSSGASGNAVKYRYGMDLDIARVVSHSDIPNVCGVVPVEMTYEDSQGDRHTLQYRVIGNGCQG
ncbi:DUF2790 domain-containing protein [Zestomonas carbonaria]